MASKKRQPPKEGSSTDELLKKLLIVQLARAGVPQKHIAKILGMSLSSVNPVAKYIKQDKSHGKEND